MREKVNLTLQQTSNRIGITLLLSILGVSLFANSLGSSAGYNIDWAIRETLLYASLYIFLCFFLLKVSPKAVMRRQKRSRFTFIESVLWAFWAVFLNFSICDLYSVGNSRTPIKINLSQIWAGLLFATLTGLYEEYVYRGIFLTTLRDNGGSVLAVICTTLLFSLMHGTQFPAPLLLSIMTGCFYVMSGNLLLPIATHIMNDWFGVLLTPFGSFLFPQKSYDEVQFILKWSCVGILVVLSLLLWIYYHFYKHSSVHPIEKLRMIGNEIKNHKNDYQKFFCTPGMSFLLMLVLVNLFVTLASFIKK